MCYWDPPPEVSVPSTWLTGTSWNKSLGTQNKLSAKTVCRHRRIYGRPSKRKKTANQSNFSRFHFISASAAVSCTRDHTKNQPSRTSLLRLLQFHPTDSSSPSTCIAGCGAERHSCSAVFIEVNDHLVSALMYAQEDPCRAYNSTCSEVFVTTTLDSLLNHE